MRIEQIGFPVNNYMQPRENHIKINALFFDCPVLYLSDVLYHMIRISNIYRSICLSIIREIKS